MSAPGSRLVLRDRLAENRTALANERTFLAYVRTALAFLAAGFSFIKFFDSTVIIVFGWVLLPAAAYTFFKGVSSFRAFKVMIKGEEGEADGPDA